MTTKKIILYIVIGFILTVVIVGSAVYFLVYNKSNEKPKEIQTYSYSIGEMSSNIKDSRRYLRVNIEIEINDEKIKEKLDNKSSEIKNNILELLRSKDETQLSGDKGQQGIRKEILKSVKSVVTSDEIMDVYFVEFIIQ